MPPTLLFRPLKPLFDPVAFTFDVFMERLVMRRTTTASE
jgi:hypothetical protein